MCVAYKRYDEPYKLKKIRLTIRHWGIIERKQKELAKKLKVKRVSVPLALHHILDEYNLINNQEIK